MKKSDADQRAVCGIQGRYLSISRCLIKCLRSFPVTLDPRLNDLKVSWPLPRLAQGIPVHDDRFLRCVLDRSLPGRASRYVAHSFEGLGARRSCSTSSPPLFTVLANPTYGTSTGLFTRQTNGSGLFGTVPATCQNSCTSVEKNLNVRNDSLNVVAVSPPLISCPKGCADLTCLCSTTIIQGIVSCLDCAVSIKGSTLNVTYGQNLVDSALEVHRPCLC